MTCRKGSYVRTIDCGPDELQAYVDADWGGAWDRKSYTGFLVKLSGALISWESKKQPTVAVLTTEGEQMATSLMAKEVMFVKSILEELGLGAMT